MNSPTIVRNAAGNVVSRHYTTKTGHDYTYNGNGNLLTFRRADGTGYDRTFDAAGNELTYTKIFPEVKP